MWIRLGERVRPNKKLLQTSLTGEWEKRKNVVYFDQQMGASHAVRCSKLSFSDFQHILPSQTEKRGSAIKKKE